MPGKLRVAGRNSRPRAYGIFHGRPMTPPFRQEPSCGGGVSGQTQRGTRRQDVRADSVLVGAHNGHFDSTPAYGLFSQLARNRPPTLHRAGLPGLSRQTPHTCVAAAPQTTTSTGGLAQVCGDYMLGSSCVQALLSWAAGQAEVPSFILCWYCL